MNLRELYNLIEMIPEAGLQYIVNRMVPPNELTRDERVLLASWITKKTRQNFPQVVKDILFLLDGKNIEWIANPTEEEALKTVYAEPTWIAFIDEPSENVQVAAIKNKKISPGQLFKLIKNPVQSVWIEVVRERPESILNMTDANLELQMTAIEARPELITRQYPWHSDVRRAAFDLEPKYFPELENPTEEQCWIGLQYNPTYIKHIPNPTPEMKAFSIIAA